MKYLLIWALLVLVIVLAGCAASSERVEVPIAVPCVDRLPAKPEACEPKDKTRPEYLRCLLVNCERNKGYTKQLEAGMSACVGDSK